MDRNMAASSTAAYAGQERRRAVMVVRPATDRSAARAVSPAAPIGSALPAISAWPRPICDQSVGVLRTSEYWTQRGLAL